MQDNSLTLSSFFAGKSILLTGATGLLAKAITEKVLRDLPEAGRLYLLIRPGEGDGARGVWERAETKIFGSGVFARLRKLHGERFAEFCRSRVTCLSGDVRLPDLGLEEELRSRLASRIDVVINSAATVSFGERLDTALETNVLGVVNLLEFARTAGAVFVQISTAYVNGSREGDIGETIEVPGFDPVAEIARLRTLVAERKKTHSAPSSLGRDMARLGKEVARKRGWFDIYTFTKFLAEHLLNEHRNKVPSVIIRPSIIESTLRSPEPGWIEGMRMADPIITAAGQGCTRFPMNFDAALDLIPLDFVVNATLASCSYAERRSSDLRVFSVATSSENPLTQRELVRNVRAYFEQQPIGRGGPLPNWTYPSLAKLGRILSIRLRFLNYANRALGKLRFFVCLNSVRSRLPREILITRQAAIYLENFGPYLKLNCRFQTANTRRLHEDLLPDERERFGFDIREIDWENYLQEVHLPGLRRNVLKLPASASASASRSAPCGRSPREHPGVLLSSLTRRYLTIECSGGENLPGSGAFILASNHNSHLDWVVLREVLGSRWPDVSVLGAEDYFFDMRLKAWFFSRFLNVIPLNRKTGVARSLQFCREGLAGGSPIVFFPEGTRSVSGELQPFKEGVGILAAELGVPVVPTHVNGTFELMPKGDWLPKRGRVEIRIGKPVEFSGYNDATRLDSPRDRNRVAAALLHERVADLAPRRPPGKAEMAAAAGMQLDRSEAE